MKTRNTQTGKRLLAFLLSAVTAVTAAVSSAGMARAEDSQEKSPKEISAFAMEETAIETEKGTLAELLTKLPEKVGILLADGMEAEIEATWECSDDYENTDYGLYTFDLVLPKGYVLGEGLTEWDLPYVEVRIQGEGNDKERIQYDPNPGGTTTIDKALGCTGDLVSWLESHEGDSYYLGTPYAGLDEGNPDNALRPNGEAGGNGQMNCTGFVASVLRHEGADLTRIGTRRPGWYANASNWQDYAHNSSVRVYRFETVSAALSSGVLKKGDILYFEPNNWDEDGADCHIGFFWGDTSGQNRFWHSATHPGRGNQISAIEPKTANSALYVFPVSHSGWIELQKSSSNTDITARNSNYSLAGAEYGIFSGGTKIATVTTDAKGYAKSGKLAPGQYVVRELKASPGYAMDTKGYQVTVQAEKAAALNVTEIPRSAPAALLLQKKDAETSAGSPQGGASLAGAQFQVKFYTRQMEEDPAEAGEKPERTWVFQTDAAGTIRFDATYLVEGDALYVQADQKTACFPLGTVTIQEVKAPQGYLRNTTVFVQRIQGGGNTETVQAYHAPSVPEQVVRGGVQMQKRDLEIKKAEPQGDAVLEGAAFTIISLNNYPVIVGGKTYTKNQVITTLVTDEKGRCSTKKDALPFGHYRVDETKAPEGYLKEGKLSTEFDIVKDGGMVDLTSEGKAILNQVIRGDLELVKVADGEQNRLSDIPFSITSVTTGESHTIVTDKNGYASTAAKWNKHTHNTNQGKTSEDGIWFGASKPDNSKGALLYDTYMVEEQRCKANESMDLLKFEVTIYKDSVTVDLGTLTDDQIEIGTTALDQETGTHMSKPEKEVTLIDTVEYSGLKKGQNYKVIGTLMDAETGEAILVDEKPVTSEMEFTAKQSSGKVEVAFTFDATSLEGKTTVIFEELQQDGKKLAVHADVKDTDQQISFPEIGTKAKDSDTEENIASADEKVKLTDTIFFQGLVPDLEYVATGRLMDAQTEEPLFDGEKPITAQTTFTPKESEGTVDVVFTFDGSSLKGKNTVIYESITQEEKEVGMHADPDFKDQQMFFPEIGTRALCPETGSQMALPKEELTIVDTVSYHLVPKKEYHLTGTLMEKESGKPLLVEGKPVTSELTFTPEEEEGSVELSFTFDASVLRGKTIVAFESVSYQEKEIAVHADIKSVPQSIYFPEIGTTAKDGKDGDQEAFAEKETQIIDTVAYKGLIAGETYRLVGTLMDKETGKEVLIDGKPVTAETTFKPEKPEGTVDVTFIFDAEALKGHDVVVFEKLYVTVKEEDKEKEVELTNHEDIQAESQTVKLTEVPTEPEKPADTPNAPKTGDTTNLWIPVAVLVAALAGIIIVIIRIRRKKF